MNNVEIKAFQDGKDFVVVFKNCTPDMRAMLEGFLHPDILGDSSLEAIPEEEQDVVINYSKYKNASASEILREEGDAGYANLRWMLSNGVITTGAATLREMLSMYAFDAFSRISDPYKWVTEKSPEECRTFIKCFSDYLTDEMMAAAAEQAGYTDYTTFINNAGADVIRSFTAAFIEKNKN